MTRWRAVVAGFALAACSEAIVFLLTGRVTLVGGLAGSAFAGYLVGPDPADGAWHGLLSALTWGIVLIPGLVALAVVGGGTLPFPFEYLAPLFDTPGEATTGVLLAVTLPNVAVGILGSLSRERDGRDEDGAGGVDGWLDTENEA
ncbi:DUF5518 domain-containing protein [Halogeometricum borinquense]|uniref:Uncharacterized protein n=1 Tax=Halogeometricum borinquense TaxID=60847 RepID=A0A6C0UR52_9EURY|nr:DUF5518 domain-containing protein [Halogeometricum borinquense]QIB75418.1 hypothetical protein G3I44_14610 [Halogeometricum borinquense]QIQ75685.1 DUF5518 domain-containing protein [Halogeometricum borinquense]